MSWKEAFRDFIAPFVGSLRDLGTVSAELAPPLRALLAMFLADLGNLLYVAPDEERRTRITQELRTWGSCFPDRIVWEAQFVDLFSGIALQERIQKGERWILTVSVTDLKRDVEEWQYFTAHSYFLQRNREVKRDHFLDFLFSLGYQRVDLVVSRGEVAVRGEVVDLFPPHLERPVRTFWWGNQVEKLRFFHPETQRTGEDLESLFIPPASGFFRTVPFLKVLEKKVAVAFFDGVAPEEKTAFPFSVYVGLKTEERTKILSLPSFSSPHFEGDLSRFTEYLRKNDWRLVGIVLPREKLEILS
ncbi:MAG: hypothetical protein ACP5Q4_11080, partial [Candidatus Caldatribacteriaceae bacterium]